MWIPPSLWTGNSATGLGGGILEDAVNPDDTLSPPGGPLTLQPTQVTGNSAAQGGGIVASTGSPVTTNYYNGTAEPTLDLHCS